MHSIICHVNAWVFFLAASLLAFTSFALDDDGIYFVDDSEVQAHLAARSEYIAREKRQRQDRDFRQALSPNAKHAHLIVEAIREEEIDNYWRFYAPVGRENEERFAGMMFQKARPFILETELWKIVKRMPKGSLLHAHLNAMVSTDVIINAVLDTNGMAISASHDVSDHISRRNATISFTYINTPFSSSLPSIHSIEYVPNTWIPISEALETFPGGREGFVAFIKSKMTISPEESYRHDLGLDAIWRKFQRSFPPISSALNYEPILRTYFRSLFAGMADDGVYWAEIRGGGSSATLKPQGSTTPDPDLDFWWRVMIDELVKFKQTRKDEDFWGVRIIWSDLRSWNRSTLISAMKTAIERKINFPELFSGYDLVAQEDLGRPLVDLAPELLWFQNQVQAANITMPFFFHAGETLGDGNDTDSNLFDAMLFQTRRIGHGFSLYKHPQLIADVIDNHVMLEVCPISNEILRLTTDILHHPLPALIAHGVPTAISNDDPTILGQDEPGLSFDFYQVVQAFDSVGLAGLGAVAQNSVRWANFEDQTREQWIRDIKLGVDGEGIKARRLQQWHQKWEDYCTWIVTEYGSRYNFVEPIA